jgi:anti-sigma factor RsiW
VTCREFNDFLMAYLDRELSGDVQAVFERHLSRCPSCDCYLRQYQATVTAGRIACGDDDEAPADIPEELIQAILDSRRRAK